MKKLLLTLICSSCIWGMQKKRSVLELKSVFESETTSTPSLNSSSSSSSQPHVVIDIEQLNDLKEGLKQVNDKVAHIERMETQKPDIKPDLKKISGQLEQLYRSHTRGCAALALLMTFYWLYS